MRASCLLLGILLFTGLPPGTAQASPPPPETTLAPAPSDADSAWAAKRRKLQIQTGVSAGVSAAALLAGMAAVVFLTPAVCQRLGNPEDRECFGYYGAAYTASAMFPISVIAAIPAIVFGVRLARHNKQRPAMSRLRFSPGGFTLRF